MTQFHHDLAALCIFAAILLALGRRSTWLGMVPVRRGAPRMIPTLPEARQAIRLTLEALDPAPVKDRRAGRFCGSKDCWCVRKAEPVAKEPAE